MRKTIHCLHYIGFAENNVILIPSW